MSNDLEAKERRLSHKALKGREEEREPFRVTISQMFQKKIYVRVNFLYPNQEN
jgi:hypothetical protein